MNDTNQSTVENRIQSPGGASEPTKKSVLRSIWMSGNALQQVFAACGLFGHCHLGAKAENRSGDEGRQNDNRFPWIDDPDWFTSEEYWICLVILQGFLADFAENTFGVG
ncbi:hypothetical protein [Stieleria varia]|nr:hypothetical protein [Stieleria varia]